MLFNSLIFIGLFLPVTLVVWWLLKATTGIRIALAWLVVASLFFYAFWDVRYLGVLLTSVGVNFWLGGKILTQKLKFNDSLARRWMTIGVSFNLLVLGGFKYSYFLTSNLYYFFEKAPPFEALVLPLAISFVTFQKIAYLVDCERGTVVKHDLLDYLFFVSFFPQLIAGPIVHHRPLIAQTSPGVNPLLSKTGAFAAGLSFFSIGLFKKVILADSLARYATPVFELAKSSIPGGSAAWQGALAYSLQLYFDFSAYSDMAIGLALMFGFKLPVNFQSPYKATSIIDFWRRWHMTLSSFLRDYFYIPLGGNRSGALTRYRNLWLTAVLAGFWHGAGWNFLLWGVAHGLFLIFNHAWRDVLSALPVIDTAWRKVPKVLLTAMTFLVVTLAWILFRSPDLATASRMYKGLLQPLTGSFLPTVQNHSTAAWLEGFGGLSSEFGWVWVSLGLVIVMLAPCSTKLLAYNQQPNAPYSIPSRFFFGLLTGASLWFSLKWMTVRPATEFLYFNF